ncbi:MAG: lysophospholipid acyltransferase family protein [Phycisphaerales bacterium]
MHAPTYAIGRRICNVIKKLCINEVVLHGERAAHAGPMLLAVTHHGNLEPVFISVLLDRPIRWMARTEFYKTRPGAWCLDVCGAFPVERTGFALPAVRRAIHLLKGGEFVGIFPEGGVTKGNLSAVRGGPIRQGVCTISIRTQIPILPVVMLGTETLDRIGPWLPFKRGRIWTAFGRPVIPPASRTNNRRDRAELANRLCAEFRTSYRQIINECGLRDSYEFGNSHE